MMRSSDCPAAKVVIVFEDFWLRLTGKEFRAFVHAPERMGAMLEATGLVRETRREALVWTLNLYRRGRDV
jgi:hypothetical protein